MSTAIRSALAGSTAITVGAAIAVSPVTGPSDLQTPRFHSAAVQLVDLPVPAFGAIPLQILLNQVDNLAALAPILIGSTEQCDVCLGPYTGYGAIGIGAGVLGSPLVFLNSLSGGLGVALGEALLAIQTPITNTFLQLIGPRSAGGFNIEATFTRAFTALSDATTGLLNIAAQALFAGPVAVIGGVVSGMQLFASGLAAGDDIVTAFNAGVAVVRTGIQAAVADLTAVVTTTRAQVYSDLTSNAPSAAALRKTAPRSAVKRAAVKAAAAKPASRRAGR